MKSLILLVSLFLNCNLFAQDECPALEGKYICITKTDGENTQNVVEINRYLRGGVSTYNFNSENEEFDLVADNRERQLDINNPSTGETLSIFNYKSTCSNHTLKTIGNAKIEESGVVINLELKLNYSLTQEGNVKAVATSVVSMLGQSETISEESNCTRID